MELATRLYIGRPLFLLGPCGSQNVARQLDASSRNYYYHERWPEMRDVSRCSAPNANQTEQ